MKVLLGLFLSLAAALAVKAESEDVVFFRHTDTLAARDEYGLVHQMGVVNPTDTSARFHWRPLYYLESGDALIHQPAYVGALQRDLRRSGYYCGEIDGIFSAELSDAIARFQKNSSMRVTGTLTTPVRRALHLP